MKRLLLLLLTVCLLAATVSADVLIEIDDSFWSKHMDQCDYLYRAYTVNSPQGYAIFYESPVSSRQRETVSNGQRISGNWHYTDGTGETWLAVYGDGMNEQGYEKIRGWVKTSECLPVPDYISFREAHESEFIGWDPSYQNAFDGVDTVCFWPYPGSGGEPDTVETAWFSETDSPEDCFSTFWMDNRERYWGFVNYWQGFRNCWVCLSDPSNEALLADEAVLPDDAVIYPPADTLPPPASGVAPMTVALVAAVVAITAALIAVLFRRKKADGSAAEPS